MRLSLTPWALAGLLATSAAQADVIIYQDDGFRGPSYHLYGDMPDLKSIQFNDRASSIEVIGQRWVACTDSNYRGRCVTLEPGAYESMSQAGLNDRLSSLRQERGGWDGGAFRTSTHAIDLYEHTAFGGRSFDASQGAADLSRVGANDKISSVMIRSGQWELCSDAEFRGQCVTLGPGEYADLNRWNFNDRLSSVRRISGDGFQPAGLISQQQGGLVLFQDADFRGRSVEVSGNMPNLSSAGFNDKATSVTVRWGRWDLCSDADFRGQCVTLGPGRYPNLGQWGLNDQLSSVRMTGQPGGWAH